MSSLHYLRNFINHKMLIEYRYGNGKNGNGVQQYGILQDVEYDEEFRLYSFEFNSSLKFYSDYPNYRIKNICDKEHYNNSHVGTFVFDSSVVEKIYKIQDSLYNFKITQINKFLGKKLNSDVIAIIKDFIEIELLDVWWNNSFDPWEYCTSSNYSQYFPEEK